MENNKKKHINNLLELIARTDSTEELSLLFEDLCTIKELENMAERCYSAKLLIEGNTYHQVMARADISSATLSRVSRCVQYGRGYTELIPKYYPDDTDD